MKKSRVPLTGMLSHDEFGVGDLVYAKLPDHNAERDHDQTCLSLIVEEYLPGLYTVQPVTQPQQRHRVAATSMRKANQDEQAD